MGMPGMTPLLLVTPVALPLTSLATKTVTSSTTRKLVVKTHSIRTTRVVAQLAVLKQSQSRSTLMVGNMPFMYTSTVLQDQCVPPDQKSLSIPAMANQARLLKFHRTADTKDTGWLDASTQKQGECFYCQK